MLFADTGIDWAAVNSLLILITVILKGLWDQHERGKQNAKIDLNTKITTDAKTEAAAGKEAASQVAVIADQKLTELTKQVNGRMDEMLKAATLLAHKEGYEQAMADKGCPIMEEKKNGGPKPG